MVTVECKQKSKHGFSDSQREAICHAASMLSPTCVWVKNFFLFFCVRAIFYEPHDASLGTMYRIENSLNVCRRLTVGENSNVSGWGMRNRKDKKWARNLLFNYHSHEVSHSSMSNRMPGIPIHDWRSIHNHLHKTKIKLNWIGKVTLAGSLRNTRLPITPRSE